MAAPCVTAEVAVHCCSRKTSKYPGKQEWRREREKEKWDERAREEEWKKVWTWIRQESRFSFEVAAGSFTFRNEIDLSLFLFYSLRCGISSMREIAPFRHLIESNRGNDPWATLINLSNTILNFAFYRKYIDRSAVSSVVPSTIIVLCHKLHLCCTLFLSVEAPDPITLLVPSFYLLTSFSFSLLNPSSFFHFLHLNIF